MIKKENHRVEPGQTVGQPRDEAGQSFDPHYVRPGSVPWSARTDGRRAYLVNERATVFDRPLKVDPVEPVRIETTTALGPIPTVWTHDLVHCRLVHVFTQASALPRILWPAGVRSALGQLQPQAPSVRRRPLGEADLAILDWTWTLVWRLGEDDRAIVRGFMAGASLRDIAHELKALQAQGIGLGKGIGKDTVAKRYRAITTAWADEWNRIEHPIDRETCEVWATAAGRSI